MVRFECYSWLLRLIHLIEFSTCTAIFIVFPIIIRGPCLVSSVEHNSGIEEGIEEITVLTRLLSVRCAVDPLTLRRHPQVGLPASPAPMDVSAGAATPGGAFSRRLLLVADIDSEDAANPQLVSAYVTDIYAYMRTLETAMATRQHYLDGTPLTGRMRAILVDWLVQVHLRFRLLQETLYLTVAIIDRFLQVRARGG